MKNVKMAYLAIIVLVLSALLSACSGQPQPAPVVQNTSTLEPTATDTPTPVPPTPTHTLIQATITTLPTALGLRCNAQSSSLTSM